MSDKANKRREWIKTAAIIFLSVMLVLTFFSQTIMNYSLPIVTSQYIQSGTISAKVRGTGTVESADLYNVQLNETRTIESIAVKKDDVVEKDQVLFYLEDKESDELKTAQAELDALLLQFKLDLLSGKISDSVISNAQAGNEASVDTYRGRINTAQTKVDNLESQVAALQKQIDLKAIGSDLTTAVKDAQTSVTLAESAFTSAETQLKSVNSEMASNPFSSAAAAKSEMDSKYAMLDSYLIIKTNAENEMNKMYDIISKLQYLTSIRDNSDYSAWVNANSDYKAALTSTAYGATALDENSVAADIYTKIDYLNEGGATPKNYKTLVTEYQTACTEYDKNISAYQTAKNNYDLFAKQATAQASYNNAKAALDNANNILKSAENAQKSDNTNTDSLKQQLTETKDALTKAQDDLTQLLTDISSEINLNASNEKIQDKKEEVNKLIEKSVGATVKAPIAGKIIDINVISGGKAEANTTVAVIQPEDKGFTLSIPVTPDQAKRVTLGTVAEIQNMWYYNDIKATLSAIKNDPQNPGKGKLLEFTIEGDVTNGQSISVSVGSKNANYDMIVPNSAIKEDNNGKFILIVESKSSPIGNRYFATRVDVEVLASDDTSSAISGNLYGYEYVISASNKPVEAGKQVRLND